MNCIILKIDMETKLNKIVKTEASVISFLLIFRLKCFHIKSAIINIDMTITE